MSKEDRRDKKRLSRIIKVEFGKEVGISLDELEHEFDDLINELDIQETVLEEEEEEESNDDTVVEEEEEEEKTQDNFQGSMTSLNKKTAAIRDILQRANRARASSTGATSSHYLTRTGKVQEMKFSASETCSLDLDADVFLSSAEESREGSVCSESPIKGKLRSIAWLNKKLPLTGGKHDGAVGRRTSDHLLIPPVLVNGAVTSNYQYMTPVIGVEKERASTLSRLIKKTPERRHKKKESTLQAMYNATVRSSCAQVGP